MARSKSAPRGANPTARSNTNVRTRGQTRRLNSAATKEVPADPPILFWVDPNTSAVPLIEDLASVGLELARDKDDHYWLRRSDKVLAATPWHRFPLHMHRLLPWQRNARA